MGRALSFPRPKPPRTGRNHGGQKMTFDMMDDSATSKCRDLSVATVALSALVGAIVAVLCGGCMGNKASHQNGIVAYVSASGPTVGLGYGETEDLPGGCVYYRCVQNSTPAFWCAGTNHTLTITYWDTRWMGVTNAAPRLKFGCGKPGCKCLDCGCSPGSCPCDP